MKFYNLFHNINIPVLIFQDKADQALVYQNHSASALFNPLSKGADWTSTDQTASMGTVLRMPEDRLEEFLTLLDRNEMVSGFFTSLVLYSGEISTVNLSGCKLAQDGGRYIQVCVYAGQTGQISQLNTQAMANALNLVYRANTTEEAINNILAFAGSYTHVSRCYIFEEISETATSNTYEWCAAGVKSEINQLKNLPKDEYTYDQIIKNGLAVTDDIRKLDPADRAILEPQGIKALAIVPLIAAKGPLGYVGFDDCEHYRSWSQGEVQLLQEIADILSSLLVRRDAERAVQYSLNILTTVTNSLDKVVCVTDIGRKTILFANNVAAEAVGVQPETLVGQPLEPVLREWGENILGYSPLKQMLGPNGEILEKEYSWEFFNQTNGRWYLMRDAIITWIDGRDVLIETATDITYQKEHEAQLRWAASTDLMTGVYNRESGRKLIERILNVDSKEQPVSLVFVDLDNLKRVNDLYGHAAGDEFILNAVNMIQSSIRKSDMICRWGGDEFVLVIRANTEQTEAIVQKILAKLHAYNSAEEHLAKLNFSYGIVQADPEQEQTAEELIALADQLMYEQKTKKKQVDPLSSR